MKKIGILFGQEHSFPPAFVERVNQKTGGKDIVAEFVKIDKVIQGEPCGYDVVIDRISQDVPFYRAWLKNAALTGTICDALMAQTPGELTFAINRTLVTEGAAVSDEEVGAAVAFAFRELKLVVEPGGAIGLAALIAGRVGEATAAQISALLTAGFVLFLITLAVNTVAATIVGRSRSGAATEI